MESNSSDNPEPKTGSTFLTLVKIVLGAALIGAPLCAGWKVYSRLPVDGSDPQTATPETYNTNANSDMTIVLRGDSAATPFNTRLELYPIDFAAAQKDYSAFTRPGRTFDDFLGQRMKGLVPVRAQFDDNGRAVAKLSEGNWWIRATAILSGGEKVEWRLPVKVFGHGQTVELTAENVYERSKTF
jgi:hypothetical protein